jgi:hypothetical protein
MSKIELIKQYKETAIAALNNYLDSMYNLTDKYFDKEGKMLTLPERNEKLESFINEIRIDTQKYESVRRKLIDENFDLSLYEINLVALSFLFTTETMKKQVNNLTQTIEVLSDLAAALMKKKEKEN